FPHAPSPCPSALRKASRRRKPGAAQAYVPSSADNLHAEVFAEPAEAEQQPFAFKISQFRSNCLPESLGDQINIAPLTMLKRDIFQLSFVSDRPTRRECHWRGQRCFRRRRTFVSRRFSDRN